METNPAISPVTRGSHPMTLALVGAAIVTAFYVGWLVAGWQGAAAATAMLALVLAATAPEALAVFKVEPARTEVSAATAQHDFTALSDEVGIGYAEFQRDGTMIGSNQTFLRLLGADRTGRKLFAYFAPHDRDTIEGAITALTGGDGKLQDLRLDPVGTGEPVLITLGYSARSDRLFVLNKDDGLRLGIEAQMRQATKMQAVGQLAGGLAHDFNNILTAIIGHCDLMLMRHGPGDIDHHDTDQIRQNANRAANLVRQLLAFSRQQTMRTRVVQIADVVGELSHLLRRLLGENVRLIVNQQPGLAPVRVDPGQIEQVLVNLAVNARDAMPGGGTLTISVYTVPASGVAALGHKIMPAIDHVAIAVTDTGSGMPREILANIFDPFFTTKEVGKGTGLGLAMAYGIVKQSNGFIFADSAPGRGTRFEIFLPAAAGEVTEQFVAPAPPPLEGWGHGTILLVEDEAMVRAIAARALTRNGYEVFTAESGEEALAILEDRADIDLLISDVVMLGMDGPALVNRVRVSRPDLRVLFISGYAEEQIRARVDDPSTPLLRKPFSVQELSAAVRARLAG